MSTEQQKKPITITLPDGKTASALVDLIVKKKPSGWSRRSYATYYKPRYAEWLKRDIDAMIKDRTSKVYRKDLWPGISMASLYLRVNQALRFILDAENGMDGDGIYRKWRNEVHIGIVKEVGVVMKYDEMLEGEEKQAESYIGEKDNPRWKMQLDEWMESPDVTEPFHATNLLLTPEQIEQVKLELDGVENIIFSVTSREVKVIKS